MSTTLEVIHANGTVGWSVMTKAMRTAAKHLDPKCFAIAWHSAGAATSDILPVLPRYCVCLFPGGQALRAEWTRQNRALKSEIQHLRTLLIDEPIRRRKAPAAGFILRRRSCIAINEIEAGTRTGIIVVPGDMTGHEVMEELSDVEKDFPSAFTFVAEGSQS